MRPSTLSGYTVDVTNHIVPAIGQHRLARLQPEHIEYLYAALLAKGLNSGSVHHVRRTLNKALNDASGADVSHATPLPSLTLHGTKCRT